MPTNPWLRSAATLIAVGAAGLTYAAAEARSYRLRRLEVPCLPAGQRPLRVLHVTDLHMTPGSAPQAGVGPAAGRAPAGPRRGHRGQPRARRRRAVRPRRARPAARPARGVRHGLQRLLRAEVQEPGALPRTVRRAAVAWRLPPVGGPARRLHRRRLGRSGQCAHPVRDRRPHHRPASASTTRTSTATGTTRSRHRRRRTPTWCWASSTRRTTGSSTRWPPTAATSCWPATPTAASSACPASARWSPTATSNAPAPRACRSLDGDAYLHVSAGLGTIAVCAGALRLPAGGDPAHADTARGVTRRTGLGGPRITAILARLDHGSTGVWRSLVARFVRDEEVVGSNPATPTDRRPVLSMRAPAVRH